LAFGSTAVRIRYEAVLGGAGVTDIPPAEGAPPPGSAARPERSRRRLIEALVGGGAALGLITAANAALPRIEHHLALSRPRLTQIPPAVARPAAPPGPVALIAFQDPEPGYPVVSPFGLRQLPWEASGRLHAGIDIAAPAGLPVLAAADGVVTRMEVDGGYGRFVEVRHAARLSTVYAHLGHFLPHIAPGVAVKAGEPIGALGSSGSSTGAHLHFEVRDDQERPLNPELFIGHSFAQAGDIPLHDAARVPRHVRVAYVSNIPKAKRDEMQAKEVAVATADAAAGASSATLADLAPNAGDAGVDASATTGRSRFARGRPHARLRLRE
jgi:hypothetical protein